MSEAQVSTVKCLPIVGSFYRPPAKMLCEHLSLGTKLYLEAEPENPHDVNAIAVWLRYEDIQYETLQALEPILETCGHSIESLEDMAYIHLGYIPKELAAILRGRGFKSAEGVFKTSAKGSPMVEFFDHTKVV